MQCCRTFVAVMGVDFSDGACAGTPVASLPWLVQTPFACSRSAGLAMMIMTRFTISGYGRRR